jgi:hypothetical protein
MSKLEIIKAWKSTKGDLLAQLLTRNHETITNTLLKAFDDKQVELNGGN